MPKLIACAGVVARLRQPAASGAVACLPFSGCAVTICARLARIPPFPLLCFPSMTTPPRVSVPRNHPSPISLLTDFGLRDGYVGTMKGVILDILPWGRILDITHEIEPQNIHQAAYVLATAAPYFPLETVHVVVVDPGVGSERRGIAVRTARAYYVGPDNGVFSRVYATEKVREIRELASPYYRLPVVSNTFHGRDIFAPFAAHIAAGVSFHSIGPLVTDPVRLDWPQPQRLPDGSLQGEILYADRFGNLISDIPVDWLEGAGDWRFELAGEVIEGFAQTYSRVARGELLALGGSEGLVEVAVREGNAAARLQTGPGAPLIARPGLVG